MLNMEKARYIYYSNLKVGTQVTIAKRTNILYTVLWEGMTHETATGT